MVKQITSIISDLFNFVARWWNIAYFPIVSVIFGLVAANRLLNRPAPPLFRHAILGAVIAGFVIFRLQRKNSSSRVLSRNFMVFFTSLSIGTLLLDMGLDGNTASHSTLLNLATGLLQAAITAILIDSLLRDDSKQKENTVETVQIPLEKFESLVARLEALEIRQQAKEVEAVEESQSEFPILPT
jgi:hypothetical protein